MTSPERGWESVRVGTSNGVGSVMLIESAARTEIATGNVVDTEAKYMLDGVTPTDVVIGVASALRESARPRVSAAAADIKTGLGGVLAKTRELAASTACKGSTIITQS